MLCVKNFKKIYAFLLIFSFLCIDEKIWAQNWPSLFEATDFFKVPQKNLEDENLKIDEKNIEKISPNLVRKKLLNSFYFVSDFISETRGERPKGWVDPKKHPKKSLELGYPEIIKRPNNKVHFPVYPLLKLYYFKGDSPVNAAINTCQEFWRQQRYQETYNCFLNLQIDVKKGVYSTTPLIKMQIDMLQGFFMLHLLFNPKNDVQNLAFAEGSSILTPFKPGELLTLTKKLFYYVATRYDESMYIPKKTSHNIFADYASFYQYPFYLIQENFKSDKSYTVVLNNESIDALSWIQSMMPLVYINTMSLNDVLENWTKGFEAIDKLENYLNWFGFPAQGQGPVIQRPAFAKVGGDIFLNPFNNLDMLSVSDLYKALALQKVTEPDSALKYISRGILRNGDPDLVSLLFKVAGDAYFDLNILQLARRSYSWSELYSKDFVYKVPAILFFGAESAFWLGQYEVAKKGFERFLLASGDSEYASQARLRLGYIEQLKGNDKNAQTFYEYIVRNLDRYPASQDAAVNLFCMNIHDLSPNVRKLEYKIIKKKIRQSRGDLKRQAKACLMDSDLMDATKESSYDTKNNLVKKVEIQKEIINEYNKEFPDNEFIVLFADRIKQLEFFNGAFLASNNKCNDLIEYYNKNKRDLNLLSKNNNKYIDGLKWSKVERKKLLRCSALVGNLKLWKEAKHFDVGKDGNPIQDKFYTLSVKPSSHAALDLYFLLKKSAKMWDLKLNKVENSGTEIIERNDFWDLLSLQKFLNYEFSTNAHTKALLANAIVKDLMTNPKLIFELPLFCSWFLQEFDKLSSQDLDAVANIKPSHEWLNLLLSPTQSPKCETTVAQNLLSKSFQTPSSERDKLILLPFLEKRGVAEASEDWLSYAKRLEQQRGAKDQNVIDIYKSLNNQAKDSLVKSAASAWIKKNFPEASDKLLW